MQTYQWNAVDYAKSSSVQQQWARELIRKLNLKGTESLLDIGAGDGKVTAEIASYLPKGSVVGIDNSREMVELAQRLYPPHAFPNLQFQLSDACNLPFKSKFDVVFSNATLHWILDHRPVLQGIYRSLKSGGKILLQMGGRGNASEVEVIFNKMVSEKEWCEYFNNFSHSYGFYSPDEYNIWLKESGLKAVRVELLPKEALHKDRSAFEGWIRTTWLPYTDRVPEEKREILITQLADEYLKHHPSDENGAIKVKMVRLEVEALKSN